MPTRRAATVARNHPRQAAQLREGGLPQRGDRRPPSTAAQPWERLSNRAEWSARGKLLPSRAIEKRAPPQRGGSESLPARLWDGDGVCPVRLDADMGGFKKHLLAAE